MSPREFLQLTDPLPEGMLLLSADGVIQAANQAAGTILAYPAAELAGRRLQDLTTDPGSQLTTYLTSCCRSRGLLPGRLRLQSGNGEETALRCRGSLVEPGDADSPALLMLRLEAEPRSQRQFRALNQKIDDLNREVKLRRRVELALRTQHNLLETTLGSIEDGVITTDEQGRISYMNPVAEKLTGWGLEEALGQQVEQVFRVIADTDRRPIPSPVAEVLASGKPVGLANHSLLVARDGTEVPIEDMGAPLRDEAGRLDGSVLTFRDVEERHRVEEDRARLLARERSARAKAEAADRAKDEFLATLSHELRTPLNAINSWLYLLRLKSLDEKGQEQALETIERNTTLQSQLVDELLEVSRLATEEVEVALEPVDAQAVVEEARGELAAEAEAKGVRLETRCNPEMGPILADRPRLRQVVTELLANAVKFTPAGGSIELAAEPAGPEGRIAIRDTGEGLSDESQVRIFQSFGQADSSHTRVHGGLGLGLAKVRRLIELQGGRVEAASPGVGLGSTFSVYLALAATD